MACNSGRLRGKQSEIRTKRILRDLRGDFPIVVISQAPKKLDARGVDIIVLLQYGGRKVPVPIQVKSSNPKAKEWRRKYPKYIPIYNVLLIVVNKSKTEEEIREELAEALQEVIDSGISYEKFYEMLNVLSAERHSRIKALEEMLLDEIPLLGSRKKMKYVGTYAPQRSVC